MFFRSRAQLVTKSVYPHNKITAITNVSTRATSALLTLHYDNGKKKYELRQSIQAGGPAYRARIYSTGCPVQASLGRGFSLVRYGNLTSRAGVSGKTNNEPLRAAPATNNRLTGPARSAISRAWAGPSFSVGKVRGFEPGPTFRKPRKVGTQD